MVSLSNFSRFYIWLIPALLSLLFVTASYGVLGFTDDYAKVTKQPTAGVSSRLRLILEVAIALAAVAVVAIIVTAINAYAGQIPTG